MEKEIIREKYYVQKIYCCDRCKKEITNPDGSWKKGSFQCGNNLQGKIGTWCSEKCFEIYEKLSPLLSLQGRLSKEE